jgi:hypothetical protein
MAFFIVTAVKTSNLTWSYIFLRMLVIGSKWMEKETQR